MSEHTNKRISAWKRGYDKAWYRVRDAVVIERGCKCEECGCPVTLRKREARATGFKVAHVDHIKSIAEAPELRLDRSNLRLLCETCHDRRTMRDQGPNKNKRDKPSVACDTAGIPIDVNHPWNQ